MVPLWLLSFVKFVYKWWQFIAGVGVSLIVAIMVVGVYRRKAVSLADAFTADQARKEITNLTHLRDSYTKDSIHHQEVIDKLDNELEHNKLAIEAVRQRAGLEHEEIVDEFARLGY
jgi:hypothetical protein